APGTINVLPSPSLAVKYFHENLAFVEVFHGEAWAGEDVDGARRQRDGDIQAVLKITEHAADEENFGPICGGLGRGDENPARAASGARSDYTGTIDRSQIFE